MNATNPTENVVRVHVRLVNLRQHGGHAGLSARKVRQLLGVANFKLVVVRAGAEYTAMMCQEAPVTLVEVP